MSDRDNIINFGEDLELDIDSDVVGADTGRVVAKFSHHYEAESFVKFYNNQNSKQKELNTTSELDTKRIAELESQNKVMREALELADEFIRNGIEFGYIRMPDECLKGIDKAHDTPNIIQQALALKKEG